jgi:hypothetical protein
MATPPVNNNLNTQQKTDEALAKLAVKNPTKAARLKSEIDSRVNYQKSQALKWEQNLEGNG